MKPITAVTIFFSLMLTALIWGYNNYTSAKEDIIEDVNQALAKTVLHEISDKVTADTLKIFKNNLQINKLKETAYLTLCTGETSNVTLCSDSVSFKSMQ